VNDISIIGGGIAGLSMAIALEKNGIIPTVYESTPELKPVGAGIALAFNAMKACRYLGVYDEIRKLGNPLDDARITDDQGKILSKFRYNNYIDLFGEVSVAIHRWDLQEALRSALHSTKIVTGKKAVDFSKHDKNVEIVFEDGTQIITDLVLACDGIHSIFRQKLIPHSSPKYSGYTCWRGIGDLPDSYPWKETMIESWGPGHRLGIVPLRQNRVYWFAVKNAPANDKKMQSSTKEDILHYFKKWNKDMTRVIEETQESHIILNDISDIDPISRFDFDNILLAGDAAHATTPNMGQGGCQAIVDAATLGKILQAGVPIENGFADFEKQRVKKTAKVIINSRQFGKLAQSENPFVIFIRNLLVRMASEKSNAKRILWLNEDF